MTLWWYKKILALVLQVFRRPWQVLVLLPMVSTTLDPVLVVVKVAPYIVFVTITLPSNYAALSDQIYESLYHRTGVYLKCGWFLLLMKSRQSLIDVTGVSVILTPKGVKASSIAFTIA